MKYSLGTLARFTAPCAMALMLGTAAMEAPAGDYYTQQNLVSDGAVTAGHTDPNLKNPWGLAFNPTGPAWVANNGTGTSTLYDGDGNPIPLVVKIPGSANSTTPAAPTGIVFNGGNGFAVSRANTSGPSRFIFATEQGTIAAWSPDVDMNNAVTVVDNSNSQAIYKGLAMGAGSNGNLLYAADFHNNRIDVFDANFKPVTLAGKFNDPNLPPGFAVFGVQVIGGNLYVSYAVQDSDKKDDVKGPSLGIINVFDPNGNFLRRFATAGPLNAPWGMALAPAGFGQFGNRLLVGNFGDGSINVFDLADGKVVGRLCDVNHRSVRVDGLWALAFGNGFAGQSVNTLYFTAGPNDEQNGLYGRIVVNSSPSYDQNVSCGSQSS